MEFKEGDDIQNKWLINVGERSYDYSYDVVSNWLFHNNGQQNVSSCSYFWNVGEVKLYIF